MSFRTVGGAPHFSVQPHGGSSTSSTTSSATAVRFASGAVSLIGYRSTDEDRRAFRARWNTGSFAQTLAYYEDEAARGASWKTLTTEEAFAVCVYANGIRQLGQLLDKYGYPAINGALRTGDTRALAVVEPEIKLLASALSKLAPWVGTSYRYADIDAEKLRAYQPGAVVTERAFVSTTVTTPNVVGTVTVVWVVQGRGGGRRITDISEAEDEVLYPPGTRFEVVSRRTKTNRDFAQAFQYEEIEMREVPAHSAAPLVGGGPRASIVDAHSSKSVVNAHSSKSVVDEDFGADDFDASGLDPADFAAAGLDASGKPFGAPTGRSTFGGGSFRGAPARNAATSFSDVGGDASSVAGVRDAYSAARFSAAQFAAALGKLPPLRARWPKAVGVNEGYSCGQHHDMVLSQFTKYFGKPEFLFALTVGLHDAGKPDAFEAGDSAMQSTFTKPVFFEAMKLMGVSPTMAAQWWPLVADDPLGGYLRRWFSVGEAASRIRSAAAEAGLSVQSFFQKITQYYQADTSSYTRDAGGAHMLDELFVTSPRGGFQLHPGGRRLLFNPEVENRFLALERELLG